MAVKVSVSLLQHPQTHKRRYKLSNILEPVSNSPSVYTAITFAPVQGFIEKSRKLRDLYGSSYLLSLLAQSICVAAGTDKVVSPALPNITQGMPNQIIIRGEFSEAEAKQSFFKTWECVVDTCRQWIEDNVKGNWSYKFWKRDWDLWAKYTWEFFHVIGAPGESITQVRQRLNEQKRSRAWTGVNWQGESSTLSGTDAVAWAELGKITQPHEQMLPWKKDSKNSGDRTSPVERFYQALSRKLGETFIDSVQELKQKPASVKAQLSAEFGAAFIDPDEELSIPELTKRLIMHSSIIEPLIERIKTLPHFAALEQSQSNQEYQLLAELEQRIKKDLNPATFKDLNRLQNSTWTGWFQGDGDGASEYLKWLGQQGPQREEAGTIEFSTQMRHWGERFQHYEAVCLPDGNGRIIYAGGDDFLGVLYNPEAQIEPRRCLNWFKTFKPEIWDSLKLENPDQPDQRLLRQPNLDRKPITPSIGFVWVSPRVPQRDVLQHCREAEQSAKRNGKDRIAFRIVFSGGNHLEWICPWRILEAGLFEQYRDRNGVIGISNNAKWVHFYNDIAMLESRHAFGANGDEQFEVAKAIFQAYFGENNDLLGNEENWWNKKNKSGEYKIEQAGILGDEKAFMRNGALDEQQITKSLNNWVINLAKVGFYLCSNT